jgi:hypothetical protein
MSVKSHVSQLSNEALASHLKELAIRDRAGTSELLGHLSEFDRRRLYAPAGYASMHEYCVRELRMSDDATFARIRTARACRRFPGILAAIEDGRFTVTSVVLLAPHLKSLTREAGRELLRAAVNKRVREIRLLLAERFPRPDVPALLMPVAASPPPVAFRQLGSNPVAEMVPESEALAMPSAAVTASASPLPAPATHPLVAPLSPGRFVFQMTISQSAHDKLRRLRALMSHEIPSGDLEQVFEKALDIAIAEREKRKYGATDKPRPAQRGRDDSRHIPAEVRRAVRERDQDRCTFVSADGQRCEATTLLEFAHDDPYATGGGKTAGNIRLLCQTHNQLEAEQTYGAEFMKNKIEQARERRKAG